MSARAVVAALVVSFAGITAAHAFSDSTMFAEPVEAGGGGARYFTGSRVDGYACSSCHRGATTDEFILEGVPAQPVAGTRYDLTVRWSAPDVPHSLHLEMLQSNDARPSVEVTPVAMLPPASRCGGVATGEPAVYVIDVGVRRVVGVEPCGASMVAVSFSYTGTPIELTIGAVRGDRSDSSAGDATFERRLTIGGPSAGDGGCDTTRGGAPWPICLAAGLGLWRRRRRSR